MRIWLSRRHLAMVAAAALGVGFLPASAASAATPAATSAVGDLRGVYCASPGSCWAVGDAFAGDATVNQMLHWNGKSWSKKGVPSPGGTKPDDVSQLFAVRCSSPASCWAVGDYDHGGVEFNQVLRWNGTSWSVVAHVPQPGGLIPGDFSDLVSITCTSATNCWAVGRYGHQGATSTVTLNQALHWNGTRWTRVTTPNPAGSGQNDDNVISGVSCAIAKDCWAVGTYSVLEGQPAKFNEILHWTGAKWTKVQAPNPGGTLSLDVNSLQGLACPSATTCFAVGTYGSTKVGGAKLNQLLRWDGKKWSVMHPGNPDGTGKGQRRG